MSVTSFLIAKIADKIQKGAGLVAMGLFLVNPNTLSAAFLIQSETLFVFFSPFPRMRCLNIQRNVVGATLSYQVHSLQWQRLHGQQLNI